MTNIDINNCNFRGSNFQNELLQQTQILKFGDGDGPNLCRVK